MDIENRQVLISLTCRRQTDRALGCAASSLQVAATSSAAAKE
jgi:hypothetical protein